MRLIGNKTHGDLAEIGIAEFIHQFMYDFECEHVGKDEFRSKEHEEDIVVIDEINKTRIPISLKAYGDGPLQLSTDKSSKMFKKLQTCPDDISDAQTIKSIFSSDEFAPLDITHILPFVYREKTMQFNIMVFNFSRMKSEVSRILFVQNGCRYNPKTKSLQKENRRKHPIYVMLDKEGQYVCEVRYGDAAANALQRGLWTHTIHAAPFFNSLTNGWISYSQNPKLVELFRLALNSTPAGHEKAALLLQKDIDEFRECP